MSARQSGGGSSSSESPTSPELDELRAALQEAEEEAAVAASEAKRIEAEGRAELDALLAEVDLDPETWRDAQAAALARREGAEFERDYAGARVLALRERGVRIAQEIAAEKVTEAEADLRQADVAVIEAEEQLAAARVAKLRVKDRLEDVRREAANLIADFDPSAALAREDRARQDRELVRWYASHPEADGQIPRHLLGPVDAERQRLEREAVEARARMQEEAAESRRKAGFTE